MRLSQSSPDGRFELRVEETSDRGSIEVNTYLVDVVAKHDLAWLGNAIEGGFQPDGMLRVVRPSWNAWDVLVDPVQQRFRVRDDLAWLPLEAWGLAHSAYGRGWSDGIEFRSNDPALAFPWTELWIALGAMVFVVLLAWKPWLDAVARVTLIAIGALVAVSFMWFTGNGWRAWRHMRRKAR